MCTLFLFLTTGCNSNAGIENNETTEYIFLPEFMDLLQLYEDIHFAGNSVILGETLYFSVIMESDFDEQFSTHRLFSVGLDGSNMIELHNFTTTAASTDADAGHSRIMAMAADAEGNLWIVEAAEFFIEKLPDGFVPDSDNPHAKREYRESISTAFFVKKLDKTGTVLEAIEINELITEQGFVWISGFIVDENHFFFAYSERIYVFNHLGNRLFTIEADGMIRSLIHLTNGNIAVNIWGARGGVLQYIDVDRRILGEVLESSQQFLYAYSGNGDFLYFISDQSYLYGKETDTGELSFGGEVSTIDITISPLTQNEKNQFMEMLNSAAPLRENDDAFTALMNIINETASDYFSGQITAQDAARIIQSRASILISEQFG